MAIPASELIRPAKIAHPRLARILHRERLYRLLDQAMQRPVIWISGPPGSGKTTLLAGFLEQRRLSSLWYQVDADDHDPASLFHHLTLAAETETRPQSSKLPVFRPDHLAAPDRFSQRYFAHLFRRLGPGHVIVFDDYHAVAPDTVLHELLRAGFAEIPPGCNVFCLSRQVPPTAWARLRANRRLALLDWEQLRLDEKEAREVAGLLAGRRLAPSPAAEQLIARCQGWAAGIVLAIESAATFGPDNPATEHSQAVIFDYFAGELFETLNPDQQSLLMQAAILPTVYPALLEPLTGVADASALLDRLARRNLFVEQLRSTEPVYRYHPLLRDFLLARLYKQYSETERRWLYRQAGRLLARAGRTEEAVARLLDGQDWPRAAAILRRRAPALAAEGHLRTLNGWLQRFPDPCLRGTPWLCYWRGCCTLADDLPTSRSWFERAFAGFDRADQSEGLLLSWAGILDTLFAEWGDFKRLDVWIERLLDHLGDEPVFPSTAVELPVTAALLVALLFRRPHHPAIRHWARRAFALLSRDGDPNQKLKLGHSLVHYSLFTGDIAGARLTLDVLSPLATEAELTPMSLNAWRHMETAYYWHVLRREDCLAAIREGLRTAAESGVHVWDERLLAQGVYLTLTLGDLDGAQEYLERIRKTLATASQLERSHYHFLRAWHDLLAGEDSTALNHVNIAVDLALETPYPEGLTRVLRAQLLHRLGMHDAAEVDMQRAREIAVAMDSASLEILTGFLESARVLAAGKTATAHRSIGDVFARIRERDYINGPLWQPRLLTRLCREALEADIEVDHVRKLIRLHDLTPEPPVPDNWPWPVRMYCLGPFSIRIDDQPLRFGRKAQRRPLDLLKVLIAHGGQAVPESVFVDHLWPDAEADAAHEAFTTTLYRLRRLLGESVVERRDGKLSLDARRCRVDMQAFEQLLDDAETDPNEAPSRLQQALNLYRGHFLADEPDAPWALGTRERLRGKWLRAVETLGRQRENQRDWDRAIDGYQRALELDDTAETFHQHLMHCYLHQGRRAEGLAAYQRCRTLLAARLGVTPSRQTETLRQQLERSR